jgi:protein O-GlcNAc transferase
MESAPATALESAVALHQAGHFAEAEAAYRRILAADPVQHDALQLLGALLHQRGELPAAIELMQRSLALKPVVTTFVNLALAQRDAGDLPAAEASLEKALALQPGYAPALLHVGIVRKALGKYPEAIAALDAVRKLAPDNADVLENLGNAHHLNGDYRRGIAYYRAAAQLRPASVSLLGNIGMACQQEGLLDDALAAFRAALQQQPDALNQHSNLLMTLSFDARCTPPTYREEAAQFGARAMQRARPFATWPAALARLPLAAAGEGTTPQPLRIGLVSGDLYRHPVGFFLHDVIAASDPARVRWHAYPTQRKEDRYSQRLQQHMAAWQPIDRMSDADAAAKIRDDGVHILIDLAGHTAHNRLPLFAWRPAPVQVSWLGFFASTGLPAMDYLIADTYSFRAGEQLHFSEEVLCLPDTRLCFSVPDEPAASTGISRLPALQNGQVTFGSFQSPNKITDDVLRCWARVLAAVPASRLRIQNRGVVSREACEWQAQRMARAGIDPQRVRFVAPATRAAYLEAHADVDLILDTFPYPGGTTTCEALLMGVPTVTLAGNTLLSRQGASLLHAAGLDDWIARDEDDFVRIAQARAANLPALSALRHVLRERVRRSPLMDAPRFASHLQAAFELMWRRFAARQGAGT